MSRNNLFLLLAGAILATMLSSNQQSTRGSRLTFASLVSVPDEGMAASVPSMFQHSFDNQ